MGRRERQDRFHDLAEFHRLLVPGFRFGTSVVNHAAKLVKDDAAATSRVMRAVLVSLTPADFFRAHQAIYGGRGALSLDEYVKLNDYGLWYVKFSIKEGLLAVHSCHESDDETVTLFNGDTLRKPDE